MKTPDEDETSNLIWCDAAVQQEKITDLQNYQVGTDSQHRGESHTTSTTSVMVLFSFLICPHISFQF